MRNLLFVMTLLLCGCGGAIKVVPSEPVGQIPKNYNLQPPTSNNYNAPNEIRPKETTPSNKIWIVLWLGSIAIAGYATYRTFKKK